MFITQVSGGLVTQDGNGWKINSDWSGGFSDISQGSEYFERLSAKSSSGKPQAAKKGETLTAHIPSGGKISGTYIGPIEISMVGGVQRIWYDYGNLDIFYGKIKGHVIQGDDGNTYIIGDQNLSDYGIPMVGGVTIGDKHYSAMGNSPEELKKNLYKVVSFLPLASLGTDIRNFVDKASFLSKAGTGELLGSGCIDFCCAA